MKGKKSTKRKCKLCHRKSDYLYSNERRKARKKRYPMKRINYSLRMFPWPISHRVFEFKRYTYTKFHRKEEAGRSSKYRNSGYKSTTEWASQVNKKFAHYQKYGKRAREGDNDGARQVKRQKLTDQRTTASTEVEEEFDDLPLAVPEVIPVAAVREGQQEDGGALDKLNRRVEVGRAWGYRNSGYKSTAEWASQVNKKFVNYLKHGKRAREGDIDGARQVKRQKLTDNRTTVSTEEEDEFDDLPLAVPEPIPVAAVEEDDFGAYSVDEPNDDDVTLADSEAEVDETRRIVASKSKSRQRRKASCRPTRASVRLATQGLGSGYTDSGRRYSRRLASKA